jgi:hypothetical protein
VTAFLPIHPAQIERWSRPRPEPVELAMDWPIASVIEPSANYPNQRWSRWQRGDAVIELMRCWDLPRNPGMPMQIASTEKRIVAGREVDLATTSMFEGAPKVVRLIWLTGEGHDVRYQVRVMFDRCSDAEIADALMRMHVRW